MPKPIPTPEMQKYLALQRKQRNLWVALLAEDTFRKAKATAEIYLGLELDENSPLHFTFASSVAITYSRFFITTRTGITLPGSFAKFPNPELQHAHEWLIAGRNTIYAHSDTALEPFALFVHIHEKDGYYTFDLEGHQPEMRGYSMRAIGGLCDFQLIRLKLHVEGILADMFSHDDVHAILTAKNSPDVRLRIPWPKEIDITGPVPPADW